MTNTLNGRSFIGKVTREMLKQFDYTTIVDRLNTVSCSYNSDLTGVDNPRFKRSTFPLPETVMQPKRQTKRHAEANVQQPSPATLSTLTL